MTHSILAEAEAQRAGIVAPTNPVTKGSGDRRRKGEGPESSRIVRTRGLQKKSGSDLLSRAVSRGVPSALEGLTSVFGMGTGVTPPI